MKPTFSLAAHALLLLLTFATLPGLFGQTAPFFPGGTYAEGIPSPEQVLGFEMGSRAVRYDEAVRYLKALSAASPRVKLMEMGETFEHRTMYLLTISSEENQRVLETHRANIGRLADPRSTNASRAAEIIESTPAVVWIGYGIHGDEISSVDASLQVAYQLAAGTDEHTRRLLRELIVCLEPMENPDGRERFLSQMQQWSSAIPNPDLQTISHQGVWPGGRGNHYLFDLNRDWFAQVLQESRNRMRFVVQWNPQVIIDSHEMGAYDTYVFSPPRAPVNPNVSDVAHKWWQRFAHDQAAAFDRYGWSYYTREWVDEWYPGYGSSWPVYADAVGILYEQAGTDGSPVKRPDGTTLTYRDPVRHHFTSSIANMTTAAANRRELLNDYYEAKRRTSAGLASAPKAFYIDPTANPTRAQRFVDVLLRQRIEVRKANNSFRLSAAEGYWSSRPGLVSLPQGTYIVPLNQPMGRLAFSILQFDPRIPTIGLQDERKSLEKEKDSKIYDVTTWSLPIVYGLDAYTSEESIPASALLDSVPAIAGSVLNPSATYGFLVDYTDDSAIQAAASLFAKGWTLRSAREGMEIAGRRFSRGTLLIRLHENPGMSIGDLSAIASATGATFVGVNTALTTKGPDLGGNDFILLKEPRIALVTGPEISTGSFGPLWYLFDNELKMRFSILQVPQLGTADIDKYTVIVIPSSYSPETLGRILGRGPASRLNEWMTRGGTLIAIGGAAAYAADTSSVLSSTRLLHQVLRDRDAYRKALDWERGASHPAIDSIALWEGRASTAKPTGKEKSEPGNEKELAAMDQRARLFMPRGAILRADLDDEHWLNFGVGTKVGTYVFSPNAFVSKDPVQTPARFADTSQIRVSGLLWPEARDRWANTAYATREARGRGQIILFADEPNFRAYFHATERLFLNAVLLGPGFGTTVQATW